MNMLEVRDLVADEWGKSEIYLLRVNPDILRDYREKYPEHVASVSPGDWVLCGFDNHIMYGHVEMIRYLSPSFDFSSEEYKREFNGISDLLKRLNYIAA
jgi:hypothetical protein